jgi:spore maturation protein CgeB
MKVQFLTSYYPPFLSKFFASHKEIKDESYDAIMTALLSEHFADTGALVFHVQKAGHQTSLIISNCELLQKKWALENNVNYSEQNWELEIAAAQIKKFKPDIFYLESVFQFFGDFVQTIKPYCKTIVSWISTPFSTSLPLKGIDLFLSSTPKFVESFKAAGFKAEYMLPAFDPRILEHINSKNKKDIPFSFVGGWSDVHVNRKEALKTLVKETPIQLWGYGYLKSFQRRNLAYFKHQLFPENKAILKAYRGEAWGINMYDILQRSVCTFNIHESLLEGHVGNMRMFEASGVGTLILNDEGHNLNKLFEVGKEIESYKTIGEAIEKAKYYISNPQKAIEIGLNAQKRTLRDYNYEIYVSNLFEFCKKQLAK